MTASLFFLPTARSSGCRRSTGEGEVVSDQKSSMHSIKWRREERWANLSVKLKDGDRTANLPYHYPCMAGCKDDHGGPGMLHHGSTVFVYVGCACGWEQLVGDHIHEPIEDGRFAFLNHKIDVLAKENHHE